MKFNCEKQRAHNFIIANYRSKEKGYIIIYETSNYILELYKLRRSFNLTNGKKKTIITESILLNLQKVKNYENVST